MWSGWGTVCGFGLKGTGIPRKLGQTGITGVDLNKTGMDCVQDNGISLWPREFWGVIDNYQSGSRYSRSNLCHKKIFSYDMQNNCVDVRIICSHSRCVYMLICTLIRVCWIMNLHVDLRTACLQVYSPWNVLLSHLNGERTMKEGWTNAERTQSERCVNAERWANAERERSATRALSEQWTHCERKMNDLFWKPRVFSSGLSI